MVNLSLLLIQHCAMIVMYLQAFFTSELGRDKWMATRAITQTAGWSCGCRSGSVVLEFGFPLDSHVQLTICRPILNSDARIRFVLDQPERNCWISRWSCLLPSWLEKVQFYSYLLPNNRLGGAGIQCYGENGQFDSDVQFYCVMQELQAWFTLQGQSLSCL